MDWLINFFFKNTTGKIRGILSHVFQVVLVTTVTFFLWKTINYIFSPELLLSISPFSLALTYHIVELIFFAGCSIIIYTFYYMIRKEAREGPKSKQEEFWSQFEDLNTKVQESQRKIQEGEIKFRKLFNLSQAVANVIPDLIWVKDIHGKILYLNNNALKYIFNDTNSDDIIDINIGDIISSYHGIFSDNELDFLEKSEFVDEQVKETRLHQRFQYSGMLFRRWFDFEIDKMPIINKDGDLTSIVTCARNVTTRFRLEQTLRREKEKFSSIFQNLPIGILLIDDETRTIVDTNIQFENIFDVKCDDIHGTKCRDSLFCYSDICPLDHSDDESRMFTFAGSQILKHSTRLLIGDTYFILECFSDVSDKIELEEELLAIKEAVDKMRLGLTITDSTRHIIYTNDTEAKMHGYNIDELIGEEVSIFSPQPTQDFKLDDEGWTRESLNIDRDGHVFPVRLVSSVIRDEYNNFKSLVTICEDIRDQVEERFKTKQLERRFESFINLVSDLVVVIDCDLTVVTTNSVYSTWQNILPLDQITIGKNIFDSFPFLQGLMDYDITNYVIEKGESLTKQYECLIDHKIVTFDIRMIPIKNGKVTNVILLIRHKSTIDK